MCLDGIPGHDCEPGTVCIWAEVDFEVFSAHTGGIAFGELKIAFVSRPWRQAEKVAMCLHG